MTPTQAIEKAIEKSVKGGWNDRLYRNRDNAEENNKAGVWTHHSSLFLDPLFWMALGKECGWAETGCSLCHRFVERDEFGYFECEEHGLLVEGLYADSVWKLQWHLFIETKKQIRKRLRY